MAVIDDDELVRLRQAEDLFKKLTSNTKAKRLFERGVKEINPDFGFQSAQPAARTDLTSKLQNIALVAVRKRFSPEFVNRIDCIITYQPLTGESLAASGQDQTSEGNTPENSSRRIPFRAGTLPTAGFTSLFGLEFER